MEDGKKVYYHLNGLALFALEAILFGSGVAVLYATENYSITWGFAVIVIINRILMVVWGQ